VVPVPVLVLVPVFGGRCAGACLCLIRLLVVVGGAARALRVVRRAGGRARWAGLVVVVVVVRRGAVSPYLLQDRVELRGDVLLGLLVLCSRWRPTTEIIVLTSWVTSLNRVDEVPAWFCS